MTARARRTARGAARAAPSPGDFASPGLVPSARGEWLVLALFLLVLLVAPFDAPWAWGVSGFQGTSPAGRVVLVLAAAAAALLAFRPPRHAWPLAIALAAAVAFPLRERIHLLGDTFVRARTLGFQLDGSVQPRTLGDLAAQFHASPLDAVVNIQLPLLLGRAGVPLGWALSIVSFALALACFAGLSRLAHDLAPEPPARVPLFAALGLTGALVAFAAYAESGGLLLAAAAWWWARALRPLRRPGGVILFALTGALALLAHRLGIVLVLAQLLRALLPPVPGDERRMRGLLLALTLGIVGLGVGLQLVLGGRDVTQRDLQEFLAGLRALRFTSGPDVVNLLVLLVPLGPAAALAAFRAVRAGRRPGPRGALLLCVALALQPLLWIYPNAPHGLGALRDWELNALLGLTLTIASAKALVTLPAGRLRGLLAAALPACALVSLGWLATHADARVAERRATLLAAEASALAPEQRCHVEVFLAYRAADREDLQEAGRRFDAAWILLPGNPRNALQAAEAWTRAGRPREARQSLRNARSGGALSPGLASAATQIEGWIGQLEALARPDSAGQPAAR